MEWRTEHKRVQDSLVHRAPARARSARLQYSKGFSELGTPFGTILLSLPSAFTSTYADYELESFSCLLLQPSQKTSCDLPLLFINFNKF